MGSLFLFEGKGDTVSYFHISLDKKRELLKNRHNKNRKEFSDDSLNCQTNYNCGSRGAKI